MVMNSNGIEKTKQLARAFIDQARSDLSAFPDSEARTVLMDLTEAVLTRHK
jgi:geranylgeranyl pyrophosphate synthase